jgi:carbonic anhydrase/acetyltransferase-like protein (isoleucine patch superfamily)
LASETYGVDIHPAAVLGSGLMLDHGTGIVIGETAVVGNNCSFLHGVTLGSSGKDAGDRHPKIGSNVLIGCNATVLGNITIGDSCKIGSGSIVTKPIPCGATAVGNPARVIGRSTETNSAANVDWALQHVETPEGTLYYKTWSINADGSGVFEEVDTDHKGKIDVRKTSAALTLRFNIKPPERILTTLFATHDEDNDGLLSKTEFERLSVSLLRFRQDPNASTPDSAGDTSNTAAGNSSSMSADFNFFLQGASLAASNL